MEKLKRLAERPFGEILFASAIVVGDGATERGFLPPVLRQALGAKAHGVCVIDPESMSTPTALAVAKFANTVGTPWFIFADSDPAGVAAVKALATTGTSPRL
ncbi:TOPRIM nucleotidyl transferase/hydrolase domain-containing protein [Oerskovia sp. M15]